MKHTFETDDKEIFKDQMKEDNLMPHLNPGSFNNNDPNLSYLDMQNKQNNGNFENMYSYGFYDEHGTQAIYVNVKQLACIQKRKARREYLDTLMAEHKNNYLHESRHRHAMQRKRAPTGRFLTKEESKKLNEQK